MKIIVLILLLVVLVLSSVMLLKKRQQEVSDTPLPAPLTIQVKVVSASTEHLDKTRPFLAKLSSKEVAAISSKLSGRIKEVLVKENQQVKKGELLLLIDDREIMASLEAQGVILKAQKKDAQYTISLHERNRSLFKAGGLAREEFEASAVAYVTKQAAVEMTHQKIVELEIQLSYLNIKAPFDGTVGTIILQTGSLASPGKSLLSINSLNQKLTFSYVPDIVAIQTGQVVFLKGKKIGQISNLYSDADNGLSVAEVTPDDSLSMPNNSYATIKVLTFSGTGCRVPLSALIMNKEGASLMLYKDKKFAPFTVSIVAENKDHALVDPCPEVPMAIASAAKLSELPSHGKVLINRSTTREK